MTGSKIGINTDHQNKILVEQELSLDIDICPRNAALKGNRYNLVPTTLLHCRFISGKNIIKILLTIKCHSMLLPTNECN